MSKGPLPRCGAKISSAPGRGRSCAGGRGYVETPGADPVYLYTDDLVGILPERNLNNRQPSLHAMLIAGSAPQPGEHAMHVDAEAGYYTALLADLVGAQGFVTAIEFDPTLGARVAGNFSGVANVAGVQGDGAVADFDSDDVIYVNAGATTRSAEERVGSRADGVGCFWR